MPKIRLALTAERDLENIRIYTLTEWGEEQASKYVGMIEQGFSQLLDNPYIGKARPDIKRNLIREIVQLICITKSKSSFRQSLPRSWIAGGLPESRLHG
jgi:plasmid stabilization system protein ParE